MQDQIIAAIRQLLSQTEQAHGQYEESELRGQYDENWAAWYASYLAENGLGQLLQVPLSAREIQTFLTESYLQFRQTETSLDWSNYTAQQMLKTWVTN